MVDVLGKVRSALFLKILLVFVGAFTVVSTYFMLTFWLFDWQRERISVQATAINYAGYVLADIGNPPDTAAARRVSERLGVSMRIEGPGVRPNSAPPAGTVCAPTPPTQPLRWTRAPCKA